MAIPCKIDPAGLEIPGYKRLEFVRSDNPGDSDSAVNYAINTGYVPNEKTVLIIDARLDEYAARSAYMGCMHVSTEPRFTITFHNATRTYFRFFSESTSIAAGQLGVRNTFEINVPDRFCRVGDVSIGCTAEPAFINGPIALLARNQPVTSYGFTPKYGGRFTLYGAKIYEGNVLLHDYVPAQEIATGINGVFDVVGKQFLSNWKPQYNLLDSPPPLSLTDLLPLYSSYMVERRAA